MSFPGNGSGASQTVIIRALLASIIVGLATILGWAVHTAFINSVDIAGIAKRQEDVIRRMDGLEAQWRSHLDGRWQ